MTRVEPDSRSCTPSGEPVEPPPSPLREYLAELAATVPRPRAPIGTSMPVGSSGPDATAP